MTVRSWASKRAVQDKLPVVWVLLLALLASACQSGPAPAPSAVALPHPSPSPANQGAARLVVVALDGARSDWINSQVQSGTMPNLAALAERGILVNQLQPVDPAVTATTYVALSTGAYPSSNGVVADKYHTQQGTFGELATPAAEVEPVWRAAMRYGAKTATVFWPGATPDSADANADCAVSCVSSDALATQHVITFQDAQDWQTPPQSYSPLREGSVQIMSRAGSTVATWVTLLLDSSDDGVSNYDVLLVADHKASPANRTELGIGDWVPVTVSPRLQSGAYLCLTACDAVSATLYSSQVNYVRAHPAELMDMLYARLGFPPHAPDVEALRAGWISPQQYLALAELRSRWMTDAILEVDRSIRPGLLLTSLPLIVDCARGLLLTDARQAGYTSEEAASCAAYLQQAHAMADADLGRLLEAQRTESSVLVLSGHGLMATHTAVNISTILKNAGLLQLRTVEGVQQIDEAKSKALALASEGSAHIYVNLQGRERPGLVPPADLATVQEQIIEALQETQGEDGLPVFARVIKREELESLHLESPNSGDVFVQAAPGYVMSDALGLKSTTAPAAQRASGGYDASLPEMQGFLVAAGHSLLTGETLPALHVTDVADIVWHMLGLPSSSAGSNQAIQGIWR